jgi:hypothetical protein
VNIEIKRQNEHGETDLKWEVSHSDRYGQPRQLAYKLDTLVINRKIDEESRPLPKVIKLGSLREIAKTLDLGSNTDKVRTALRQNVGAMISAKLTYKASDGTERSLEADFNRYSAIFTGEKLPNGEKADAVYLVLNDIYKEVLDNAPARPLNYSYLKELPPAPQRFYEIISYRFFAAFKYKHPHAKLLYSEYCTFSAQARYFDYDHFKKQMYKVHLPHIKSGYIQKAWYERSTDSEGKPDFIMFYIPGAKARAEYNAFTRRPQTIDISPDQPRAPKQIGQGRATRPKQPKPEPRPQPELSEEQQILHNELIKRGIVADTAQTLVLSLAANQHALDQLEWGDFQLSQAPAGKFTNPPGFYIYLIRDNIPVPESFETSRKKNIRQKIREAKENAVTERLKAESAYEDYQNEELEKAINALPPDEYNNLFVAQRDKLLKTYKQAKDWSDEMITNIVRGYIRSQIREKVEFADFETFREKTPHLEANKPEETKEIELPGNSSQLVEFSDLPEIQLEQGRQPKPEQLIAYEQYKNNEAVEALQNLSSEERSKLYNRTREYLLNEHLQKETFNGMLDSGQFKKFHKIAELFSPKLFEQTFTPLNFDEWLTQNLTSIED